NVFVAGFIGSPPMNFIDGSLVETDDKLAIDIGPLKLPLPEDITTVLKEAGAKEEVIFGIRPEDIQIKPDGEYPAEIYVVEPLGRDLIVHLNLGEGVLIRALVPAGAQFNIGEKVKITFDIEKAHIFDRKTEKAYI
ncbi:MAG: sugar ABC transporter ATP-binding protein, partial [Thermoprotei archaeon]